MTQVDLETKTGPLAEIYNLFRPETIQHADEITAARINNPDLRTKWFWTADFPLYRVEDSNGRQATEPKDDDDAVLYLARRENNLLFENIQEGCRQLIDNDNYVPEQEGIDRVVKADTTLKVKLSDLDLKEVNSEWRYFAFDTTNLDVLNKSQRALAERVYGPGDDFAKNMKMLNDEDISNSRVCVLNPNYIKEKVGKEVPALTRAGWLGDFYYDSDFSAEDWEVNNLTSSLRGVILVGEADAKKDDPLKTAYQTLAGIDPEIAAENLSPKHATALSRILTSYISQAKH